MANYIDRDKVFPNGTFFASVEDPLASLDELIKRIWGIPVVDAVPVVRCRDCRHCEDGLCYHPKNSGLTDVLLVLDDDFCSSGERREEGGYAVNLC
jgi:hypothetical protein